MRQTRCYAAGVLAPARRVGVERVGKVVAYRLLNVRLETHGGVGGGEARDVGGQQVGVLLVALLELDLEAALELGHDRLDLLF